MKTYTTTIQKPRLEIRHDQDAENPREWDNLGYFIMCEDRYKSPDYNEALKTIIEETQYEADNAEEHIKAIKMRMHVDLNENVLAIYPVYRYEHGAVMYKRGEAHGFDYSNCGFYIVTDKTAIERGVPKESLDEYFYEDEIDAELELYTKYANGEVYQWTLYDVDGETEDSGGDYYDLDEIKAELGDEWKDEDLSDYLIYN